MLRGCDLVRLQIDDVSMGGRVRERTTVVPEKTSRPVRLEFTEQTRASIQNWSKIPAGLRTAPIRSPRAKTRASMRPKLMCASAGRGALFQQRNQYRCDEQHEPE